MVRCARRMWLIQNEFMVYATIRQHGDAVTTVKTTIGDEGVNEGVNEGVSALGKGAKETYSIICSNPGLTHLYW